MRRLLKQPALGAWIMSNVARPAWMDAMIRKWMYNPPKPPLREWFHYDSREGIRLVRTVESPS